jgi:uncharacterized RDD family membrane protein YckC
MDWSDELQIETPEQVDVSLEIAGLGSRLVAWVTDGLIKIGFLIVLFLVGWILLALVGLKAGVGQPVAILLVVLVFLFLIGYGIYFELWHNGQTPGKKRAGIRVIREGGAPLDFGAACIRNLLALADFLPFSYLVGGLLVLLTKQGQRLGDIAAGTIVIRERALGLPGDPMKEVERFATDELAFTADQLAACRPEDRHVLRSFFQRYRELDRQARKRLAVRLADEFCQKTSYQRRLPLSTDEEARAFLASLYRDLENLARHGR